VVTLAAVHGLPTTLALVAAALALPELLQALAVLVLLQPSRTQVLRIPLVVRAVMVDRGLMVRLAVQTLAMVAAVACRALAELAAAAL
jgi:hypothetical protein